MTERLTADNEYLILGNVPVAAMIFNKNDEIIANRLIERYNAGQDAIQAWRDYKKHGDWNVFNDAMNMAQSRAERIF
jgi:tRNA(Arg) A34 adenosine deaminase TadA